MGKRNKEEPNREANRIGEREQRGERKEKEVEKKGETEQVCERERAIGNVRKYAKET